MIRIGKEREGRRGDPSLSLNTAFVLILAVYAVALAAAVGMVAYQNVER